MLSDGKTIVSGAADCSVLVQSFEGEISRRTSIGKQEKIKKAGSSISSLGIAPDGRRAFVSGTTGTGNNCVSFIRGWDLLENKSIVERSRSNSPIIATVISPDAKLAFHTSLNQSVVKAVVEDTFSGGEVVAFNLPEGSSTVAANSADSRTFATFTNDSVLNLWETSTGRGRQTIRSDVRQGLVQVAFTPSGRSLAIARADKSIQIWDIANNTEILRMSGFPSPVRILSFSHDGTLLASAHVDGTILVWELDPSRPSTESETTADRKLIDKWLLDLASPSAEKGFRAMWQLANLGDSAVGKLRDTLSPPKAVSDNEVKSMIAALDSDSFVKRETATKGLLSIAGEASPALRAALKAHPSAEQRRRIEAILTASLRLPTGELVRDLRIVETLEHIGTLNARHVLNELAQRGLENRLTRDASTALERSGAWTEK